MKLIVRPAFGFLFAFILFGTSACKKEEETSLIDNLVGSYSFEGRVVAGYGSFSSGTLEVSKTSDGKIKILVPADSTNLLGVPTEFIYSVGDNGITEIPGDSTPIANPSLSRLISGGVICNYLRTSTGVLSGSFLVIDGQFTHFKYDPIVFKLSGVKIR